MVRSPLKWDAKKNNIVENNRQLIRHIKERKDIKMNNKNNLDNCE